MDVFERVREVNAGAGLTESRVADARSRLMDGIEANRTAERKRLVRRPVFVIAGAVATVAAVTATAVVINQPASPSRPPIEAGPVAPTVDPREPGETIPKPVTASSVLNAAAQASGANTAPAPQQGQYLKIERDVDQLITYGTTNPNSMFDASRADATAAWNARSRWTVYVPADRSGEWVQEFSGGSEVTDLYGDFADVHAQEWLGRVGQQPFFQRTPGGLGATGPGETSRASDAYYADFPRDPEGLLEWIRVSNGATDGTEWSIGTVTEVLLQELQYNMAPADLRAAMYEALRLLPNATLESVDGDIATISFGSNATRWVNNVISIDVTTGLVVGASLTQDPGSGIVPDSVPDSSMTIRVTVVDSAP